MSNLYKLLADLAKLSCRWSDGIEAVKEKISIDFQNLMDRMD